MNIKNKTNPGKIDIVSSHRTAVNRPHACLSLDLRALPDDQSCLFRGNPNPQGKPPLKVRVVHVLANLKFGLGHDDGTGVNALSPPAPPPRGVEIPFTALQ